MDTKESIIGKNFIAQEDIEKHKVLYKFKFGGGIKGGCVKAGHVIKVLGYDSFDGTYFTDKVLNRMKADFFYNTDLLIQL